MREEQWLNAYESVGPDADAEERIWESLMREVGSAASEMTVVRPKKQKKLWRTMLLVAALAGAMGATAYAAGLFGTEALEIREPEITPQKLVIGEDGKGHKVDNPEEGAMFSITQPQELPDNAAPEIREKFENNKAAWAEWEVWREENRVKMPEVFQEPEGAHMSELIEHEDGSRTLVFSRPNKTEEELIAWVNEIEDMHDQDPEKAKEMEAEYSAYHADPDNWVVLEERNVSAEELEQYEYFISLSGKYLEGYDYYYRVQTEEQGKKLEEIVAKYGLSLRGDKQTLFGGMEEYYQVHERPDWVTDEMYEQELQESIGQPTADNLAALSDRCCRGDLFLTPPPYVDHLYWYEEGTFAVDFSWVTESGKLAECYLYNSMYGTLSSGWELFDEIEDVAAYASRAYLTKDGAEVTILESDHANAWGRRDASYLFVYLEDSFLVIKVDQPEGLSREELNEIADSVHYSVINK